MQPLLSLLTLSPPRNIENWKIYSVFWKVNSKCIGAITESKGMRSIFQKKGKKVQKNAKKGKKQQNIWKFGQKCSKFEIILKKSRWLRAIIARNKLLEKVLIYSAGVRPVKATGTRWIDHKIWAMGCIFEKFCLNNQNLRNVFSANVNAKARAALEEKHPKLVGAKILLRCALFNDVLAEAKNFSLKTKDWHKHHWCCWGCQKHKARLLKITERRGERPSIDSQVTHAKTHNWQCWSKWRWWRSYQDVRLKHFFAWKRLHC